MPELMKIRKLDLASIPLIDEHNTSSYTFKLSFLTNYKKIKNRLDYEYYNNSEVIKQESDYFKWLFLQALNTLTKIYLEQSDDDTIIDITMSSAFFTGIKDIIDNVDNDDFMIEVSFDDSRIEDLMPYLCGYMALTYQQYNEEKTKELIEKVLHKLKKNVYQVFTVIPPLITKKVGEQLLKSSIPFIELEEIIVGIEFLAEDKKIGSLVNVYILNKGKFIKYNNIFIKLDPKYILDTKTKQGRLYRQGVLRILIDQERAGRLINKRAGYFGIIELDLENSQINKLVEADTLYDSDKIMAIKKYKNIHHIDSYIE